MYKSLCFTLQCSHRGQAGLACFLVSDLRNESVTVHSRTRSGRPKEWKTSTADHKLFAAGCWRCSQNRESCYKADGGFARERC